MSETEPKRFKPSWDELILAVEVVREATVCGIIPREPLAKRLERVIGLATVAHVIRTQDTAEVRRTIINVLVGAVAETEEDAAFSAYQSEHLETALMRLLDYPHNKPFAY